MAKLLGVKMTPFGRLAGHIRRHWTPAHTTVAIVLAALAIGLLPFVQMGLVVNGVFLGAIIALGAVGLTLIYGILHFANFAHGDYMTMGAYVALFITASFFPWLGVTSDGFGPFTFGYTLLIALPVAALAVVAGAILLDKLIYRRLRDRGVNDVVIAMASMGVAIAMRGLVQMIWGGGIETYPRESKQVFHLPMDVRIPPDAIFIAFMAVVLVAMVYLLLTRTRIGKAMRATADNPELALVSGIGVRGVTWWTWGIGAALAATAGVLLAVFQGQLLPIMGWKFLIPVFSAVVLGGIGNPYGALVAAFAIGVTSEVSTQWMNPSYKPAIAFAMMIAVLLLRPKGLFTMAGSGR